MDEDVLRVLEATIIKYLKIVTSAPTKPGTQAKVTPVLLIKKLRDASRTIDAANLETIVRDAGFESG
jgi:hypothetical protein